MVSVGDVFATPIGLAALAAAVPIVLLYLVKPEPERIELPTMRFLAEDEGATTRIPVPERLWRNLLLLVQLLAVALLAASLATPFTLVTEQQATEESVLVVDTSASMQTETGDGTRFERAIAAARDARTATTSVVDAGPTPAVVRRRASRRDAAAGLDGLAPVDAAGDLGGAITRATAIADDDARIVVFSDFAGDDWETAVETARARGYRVVLRGFDGGRNTAGITDLAFSGTTVRASVTNYGTEPVERELELGGVTRTVTVAPDSVGTATLPLPPGGGELRLTPGDDFALDDVAYVAAPADRTVDVLLVTNDRNRFLATALDVIGTVSLTTVEPPAPDADVAGSDVVVFSNVEAVRLLGGTVDAADRVVKDGGGVAIQAQPNLADVNYGPLLPITPTGSDRTPSVRVVEGSELVRGISFPQPEEYLTADAGRARPLVTADDSPLIATASRGGGRLLYYGYMEDTSTFKFNYQYPVFWKRAVFELAGRQPASVLSRSTGEDIRFGNETPVRGPEDERTVRAVQLDRVGWYETPDRRYGASLLDPVESSVEGTGLSGGDDGPAAGTEQRLVPKPLTHWTALAALLLVVVELGYLRRRGDL